MKHHANNWFCLPTEVNTVIIYIFFTHSIGNQFAKVGDIIYIIPILYTNWNKRLIMWNWIIKYIFSFRLYKYYETLNPKLDLQILKHICYYLLLHSKSPVRLKRSAHRLLLPPVSWYAVVPKDNVLIYTINFIWYTTNNFFFC